jgi:hypothetical protein
MLPFSAWSSRQSEEFVLQTSEQEQAFNETYTNGDCRCPRHPQKHSRLFLCLDIKRAITKHKDSPTSNNHIIVHVFSF